MSAKAVIRMYVTIIIIMLLVSAFFLFRDIRSGELFKSKLNFFQISLTKGKESCDVSNAPDCIPNPVTLLNEELGTRAAHAAGNTDAEIIQNTDPRFPEKK